MTLLRSGRAILIWGMLAALISAAPALALIVLPQSFGEGFFGLVAIMLTLTVTPLAVLVASAGAILLLLAALRRGRS